MTEGLSIMAELHFLRPGWLALAPAALLVWWLVRSRATAGRAAPKGVAPHLARALTVGEAQPRRLLPVDGVLAVLLLLALGAAGPTWTHVPNPLVAQTAPLAVVISASESMSIQDVAPSRMERARQKVLDLVTRRSGARTALLTYAGTAHRVVPLTEDPVVLAPFIAGLSPEIMPEPGEEAEWFAAQEARRAAEGAGA